MTDKQIIIDGVDVSGCSWHTQGATGMICADWHISNDCSKNPNCYYKQLKRKEQECEQQKAELELFKTSNQTTIDQLKAENERLQEEREKAKNYNLEYGQLLIKATNKNNKLKQTLAEIKEIVETENNDIKVLYNRRTYQRIKQILQKISEVENDL